MAADPIAALRAFNRFHTQVVGALSPRYMGSAMGLPEARLLYEIINRAPVLASELHSVIGIDPGQASRLLRKLEERGWITRERGDDARCRPIAPTDAGRAAFAALDDVTRADIERRLAPLDEAGRATLVEALGTARGLLSDPSLGAPTIRPFRTGDMGMIAARQAILYGASHGWGRPMEALLGEVTAAFLRGFDPAREQCWVAERDGRMIGSIFCCRSPAGDDRAQLRLLYVEPEARGLGVGEALVQTCVEFARDAGYPAMWLWTHSVLLSARRIYAKIGFAIISTEVHHAFGQPEQGETWELRF